MGLEAILCVLIRQMQRGDRPRLSPRREKAIGTIAKGYPGLLESGRVREDFLPEPPGKHGRPSV